MTRALSPAKAGRPIHAIHLAVCAAVLAIAGCGNGGRPSATVTEEGGVRITVSRDEPVVFADVGPVPSLSIGGPDTSGPTQFFQIQNLLVDAVGRIWVADGGSGELRIFQADGSPWKTVGGRGEGPGEFRQIHLLGAVHGDSVLVGDGAVDRLTVFDPEGEFVRSERIPPAGDAIPRLFDVFEDGSLLGQVPRVYQADALTPGQIIESRVELVRMSLASTAIESYGSAEGPLWLWTGLSQVPLPFTINASFDVAGEQVYLVSGPVFEIREFSRGEVTERFGVSRPSRLVTDEDIEAYRDFIRTYVPEPARMDYAVAIDQPRRPNVLPAYDRVLAAPSGFLWAQVYDSDVETTRNWDVFDARHRFVGQVLMPEGFQVMTVLVDAAVGVWRDEVGTEYVRTYELELR